MRALQYFFQTNKFGGLMETSDYAQIVRGQVIDALMTNLGERVFRPRYGCDIQAMLFDPSDELVRRDAAGMIKKRLEQLVPRAIIRRWCSPPTTLSRDMSLSKWPIAQRSTPLTKRSLCLSPPSSSPGSSSRSRLENSDA